MTAFTGALLLALILSDGLDLISRMNQNRFSAAAPRCGRLKMNRLAMRGFIFIPCIALAAALVVGCEPKKAPESKVAVDEVNYDLPVKWNDPSDLGEGVRNATEVMKATTPAGLKWTNDHLSFEVVRKAMTLNGTNYGVVKAGDQVKLTEQGTLLVNGVERRPETASRPASP